MRYCPMFRLKPIGPALVAILMSSIVAASAQKILSPTEVKGKKILLVVGEPEKGETNDDGAVKQHLEAQGYVVTVASEDDPASKATGQVLVILSSTADPREIADKYAALAIPVFSWNAVDYPDM